MAVTNYVNKGFHPVDACMSKARRYTVASAYAPANSLVGIAPGEVVRLVTAGTIEVAGAGDTDVLGVVASVSYINSDGMRVTASYLPTGYTYTGDNIIRNPKAPIIYVWDDPTIEYLASVATATTEALAGAGTGANMDLSATSSSTVDTVFKRSLRTLSGTFVAGTAQFRIVQAHREPSHSEASANWRIRCQINEGFVPSLSAAGI